MKGIIVLGIIGLGLLIAFLTNRPGWCALGTWLPVGYLLFVHKTEREIVRMRLRKLRMERME